MVWTTHATKGLILSANLALAGCMAAPPEPALVDRYPGVPVVSRMTYTLQITGEQEQCYGMAGTPQPCFVGIKPTGETVSFDEGIQGYTFQPGHAEQIMVEEVRYDFSSPDAPMDTSSIVYTKVDG